MFPVYLNQPEIVWRFKIADSFQHMWPGKWKPQTYLIKTLLSINSVWDKSNQWYKLQQLLYLIVLNFVMNI